MQENKKFTKLRKNVFGGTGCLEDAAVLCFIMDGAEIQGTDSPVIAKSFIGECLKIDTCAVQNALERLFTGGWFRSIEDIKFEKLDGKKVPSTRFNLSGKAIGMGCGLQRNHTKHLKYTKLRKEILEETGDLTEASVMSFIIDGAQMKRSGKPVISLSYMQRRLNVERDEFNRAIRCLQECGWFSIGGSHIMDSPQPENDYVQFILSEKALEDVSFPEEAKHDENAVCEEASKKKSWWKRLFSRR